MWIFYILSVLFIGLDQLVKYLVVQNIALHETVPFINGLISWTYVKNTGAAWSILEGKMWFFYVITPIALIVILYIMQKYAKNNKLLALGMTLVLSGAIGNFIDRIHLNYVVDMIQLDFFNFPIFNVADMCLTIGVVLIAVYILMDDGNNKTKIKGV